MADGLIILFHTGKLKAIIETGNYRKNLTGPTDVTKMLGKEGITEESGVAR
jgi:hypothetical protein